MTAVAEKAPRRWFRITPDRCVLGLLPLEGFLLLSAWFHWFAFNQHKGWTVLVAVASVGVALVLMFLWFLAALVFRLRFQFSILALLVLVVVVAVPCSWLAAEMKAAKEQRQVVEGIEKVRGRVTYDYKLPGPVWLRNLLGDDLVGDVTQVDLRFSEVSDAGLERFKGLPRLQTLDLYGTEVSDAGLQYLKGLTRLKSLDLNSTKVSDAGLEHLKGLTQLQVLDLSSTNVSDTGLEHLKRLTQLQRLYLMYAKVGDTGMEHLKGLGQLQTLDSRAPRSATPGCNTSKD